MGARLRRTRRRAHPQGDAREQRLRELVDANHAALLGYARRRLLDAEDAADVVCEVLLVAWRRIDEVPAGDEARLWLYGVARNVLNNHRRGARRRGRLAERLRDHVRTAVSEAPDPATMPQVVALREAMATLDPADRELIALSAWEGLGPSEIAAVLGIEPGTARVRLHRARTRLRRALSTPGDGDDLPVQRAASSGQVTGGRATARPETQEVP